MPAVASQFHSEQARLYDITATSSAEGWAAYGDFRSDLEARVRRILQDGREHGEFKRKTPMDEVVRAIMLSVRRSSTRG